MAKLSKSDAARYIGVSRQTLYQYITSGRISIDQDGLIDTSELLRAGFVLRHLVHEDDVTAVHDVTPSERESVTDVTPRDTTMVHQMIAALQRERDLLKQELEDAKREKAQLLDMLQEEQRHRRLLEAGQESRWEQLWPKLKVWLQGMRPPREG